MLSDTITVFNFHPASGSWYPSVLSGVNVEHTQAAASTTTGKQNTSGVDLIVPCSIDKKLQTSAGAKQYVGPKAFRASTAPAQQLTFAAECDFVYLGTWPSLDPLDDEDYDEGLYQALNHTYDNVYMIRSAIFYDVIPHFELGGD